MQHPDDGCVPFPVLPRRRRAALAVVLRLPSCCACRRAALAVVLRAPSCCACRSAALAAALAVVRRSPVSGARRGACCRAALAVELWAPTRPTPVMECPGDVRVPFPVLRGRHGAAFAVLLWAPARTVPRCSIQATDAHRSAYCRVVAVLRSSSPRCARRRRTALVVVPGTPACPGSAMQYRNDGCVPFCMLPRRRHTALAGRQRPRPAAARPELCSANRIPRHRSAPRGTDPHPGALSASRSRRTTEICPVPRASPRVQRCTRSEGSRSPSFG